jgi:hypothetical protein
MLGGGVRSMATAVSSVTKALQTMGMRQTDRSGIKTAPSMGLPYSIGPNIADDRSPSSASGLVGQPAYRGRAHAHAKSCR